MVNKKILCGLFSIMLAIVFALSSCDMGDNDNGNGTPGGTPGVTLPAPSGTNEVGGKTYFRDLVKTVFAVTTADATYGTYEDGSVRGTNASGHHIYETTAKGNYTWNYTAKTITLQPIEVSVGDGIFHDRNGFMSYIRILLDELTQAEINDLLSEFVLPSFDALIDLYIEKVFGVRTFDYSFSTDGAALLLQERLPANVGTNELTGQFYGMDWDNQLDKDVKDTNRVYTFNYPNFTFNNGYGFSSEGRYSYNSTRKTIFLRPEKVNGKNIKEYHAAPDNPDYYYLCQYFANTYDADAAATNDQFHVTEMGYDLTDRVVELSRWF